MIQNTNLKVSNIHRYYQILYRCLCFVTGDENIDETGKESESEESNSDESEEYGRKEYKQNSNYYYGKNRFKWSKEPATSNRGRRPQHNIVLQLPGLRETAKNIGDSMNPFSVWKLLFSDEICETVLKWTNVRIGRERARYKNQNSPTLRDLDMTELYAFMGFLAFTSVFKSNNENLDTIFATNGTGREIIRCIMSKERCAFLLTCLRFDNPDTRDARKAENPAAPVSEIFDIFIENCQNCYSIGKSACIDEMLVGFRGRCKFKMYIPNKPVKYGIKIMCCTDARTNYLLNAYIYTGRNSDGNGLTDGEKRFSKPTQAVLRLTTPLIGSNRSVTFDNWFTSIELVQVMKQRGLTCIGTLKKNKKEVPAIFLPTKKREVGTTLYGYTKDITLISYTTKINKAVLLVSSSHHHASVDPLTNKPDIIADYNCTKGGVDTLDEKCSKFSCSRRTRRWSMAVFFRLFDISTVNAYILYESYRNNNHLERSKFIEKLAFHLVEPQLKRRVETSIPRKIKLNILEILGVEEVNQPLEMRVEKLERRKDCSLCHYKKKRRTAYVCWHCQRPICLECAKKLCRECAEKNQL